MTKIHILIGSFVPLVVTVAIFGVSEAIPQEKGQISPVDTVIVRTDSIPKDIRRSGILNIPIDTLKARRNWFMLKRGLSVDSVMSILGSPTRIWWDYENAIIYLYYGKRAVVFNAMTKRVSGWDK